MDSRAQGPVSTRAGPSRLGDEQTLRRKEKYIRHSSRLARPFESTVQYSMSVPGLDVVIAVHRDESLPETREC